jgi:hypothetical protein
MQSMSYGPSTMTRRSFTANVVVSTASTIIAPSLVFADEIQREEQNQGDIADENNCSLKPQGDQFADFRIWPRRRNNWLDRRVERERKSRGTEQMAEVITPPSKERQCIDVA